MQEVFIHYHFDFSSLCPHSHFCFDISITWLYFWSPILSFRYSVSFFFSRLFSPLNYGISLLSWLFCICGSHLLWLFTFSHLPQPTMSPLMVCDFYLRASVNQGLMWPFNNHASQCSVSLVAGDKRQWKTELSCCWWWWWCVWMISRQSERFLLNYCGEELFSSKSEVGLS